MTRREAKRIMVPRLEYLFRFIFPHGIGRLQLVDISAWKTAHGFHLLLAVNNELGSNYLVLLQTLLGSDFRREAQNWQRASWMRGYSWNRLYTEKIDEAKIRRKRRLFHLRKVLRLNPYRCHSTGRLKTVGREIPDPKLSAEFRRIIRQAQKKPPWN